ncbi:permease-like cell division protein FtsX [Candidatus Woesebacteria bacterium]|nr:permease-like cell division protein FtsX [Candidatus Woesebacteria bacterium]
MGQAFRSALVSMRRSPYQTLAATLLVTVTAIVGFSLAALLSGSQLILRYYENQPQVIAFFNVDATPDEIAQLDSLIKSKPYAREVHLTSQSDALEIYRREYKDAPLLLELVTAQMLPASVEVKTYELSQLVQATTDLRSSSAINEVVFQQQVVDSFSRITSSIRNTGLMSAGVLAFLSLLIITIVISMKVNSARLTISTMRMLGASKGYVRFPYMLEGALYGLIGAVIGWITVFLLLLYFGPTIQSYVAEVPLIPIQWQFFAWQAGIGVSACIILGATAGQIASSRMIKKL